MLVRPLTGHLAAEIVGLDLDSLTDPGVERALRDALFEYLILLIRAKDGVRPAQQSRLARVFGTPTPTRKGHDHPEDKCVQQVVSTPDTRPTDDQIWHADGSFREYPTLVTVLTAVHLPEAPGCGDTYFADTRAAYESLPTPLRDRVRSKRMVFSFQTNHVREQLAEDGDEVVRYPDITHPLVRRHPVTGRDSLFLDMLSAVAVEGEAPVDSREIINHLYSHTFAPERMWTHRWREGDLLVWDNSCLIHRRGENRAGRRVVHRTTIPGPRPAGVTGAVDQPLGRASSVRAI